MNYLRTIGGIILACGIASATTSAAPLTVPAGATVTVRMLDSIDTGANYAGETFRATLDSPLLVDGQTVIPKGSEAIGRLVSVERSRRIQGRPMLILELTALNFEGKSVAIQTGTYQEMGPSQTKRTAILAGGGAALGTILSVVAGGGFLLGSNVGAAAGTAVQAARGGKQLRIPGESLITFTLQSPIYMFDSGL